MPDVLACGDTAAGHEDICSGKNLCSSFVFCSFGYPMTATRSHSIWGGDPLPARQKGGGYPPRARRQGEGGDPPLEKMKVGGWGITPLPPSCDYGTIICRNKTPGSCGTTTEITGLRRSSVWRRGGRPGPEGGGGYPPSRAGTWVGG